MLPETCKKYYKTNQLKTDIKTKTHIGIFKNKKQTKTNRHNKNLYIGFKQ